MSRPSARVHLALHQNLLISTHLEWRRPQQCGQLSLPQFGVIIEINKRYQSASKCDFKTWGKREMAKHFPAPDIVERFPTVRQSLSDQVRELWSELWARGKREVQRSDFIAASIA